MAKDSEVRVHLDHIISRESLRWVDPRKDQNLYLPFKRDPMTKLKYKDLVNLRQRHNQVAVCVHGSQRCG